MNDDELVAKLEESMQHNLGDWGRTQYLIERIQKEQEIFQSDKKYLDRMLAEIQKIHQRDLEGKNTEKVKQRIFVQDLIKCDRCESEIGLDQRAIRKKNFWFHELCYNDIPISRQIEITKQPIHEQTKKYDDYFKIEDKPLVNKFYPFQIIFTLSMMISLIASIYFLFDRIFSIVISIVCTALFIVIYKSQFQMFNNKKYNQTHTSLIKTGIPGFESLISNGLKKNSAIIISGPPGSGKTTFGLQFLYSGARDFDEPGVYITMSQNIDEIKNDCKSFGWDFDDLINKDKIMMIDARPFKIQDEIIGKDDSLYRGEQMPFEHLTKLLLSSIKRIEAKRVVIDSVTILAMQYLDKFYMRQGLQGMIQALENYGVTSLIISEHSENNEIPLEWFVTSGIIQMDNQIIENTPRQTIQIKKLRGIKHSQQIHPIRLEVDGLHILEA
ncbi:ATPase domain-containing protein [Nitrosarchaeum sp.]|uniref:RAD55 family ATPase n=1 Tax=Nitrosarchaeum sp. TaxID=2026886 RepID=UPI00263729F7|nr:ATPase domain-containing protein [Nitrosarchaeum sp.]